MTATRGLGPPPAWTMERWKFFHITHASHTVMNPLAEAALDEVVDAAGLGRGDHAVDLGCGKAELLVRLARRGCAGTGVDLSPFEVDAARRRVRQARVGGLVQVAHGDGAAFRPPKGKAFELAACVGATWMFGGYRGTLRALVRLAAPGGLVLVGEPSWNRPPAPGYLRALGFKRTEFLTHAGNVRAAAGEGLLPLRMWVSTPQDFDRYEGLQWAAADTWARSHPDDPDVAEVTRRVAFEREAYMRWGRDTLGWACYLFRKEEKKGARGRTAPGKGKRK